MLFGAVLSIFFLAPIYNSFPQIDSLNIRGWVYDSSSSVPLPNVNVIIRGTKIGCTSDTNGFFQLKLPGGKEQTIVFSHLGYSKEVRLLKITAPAEFEYRIYLNSIGITLPEIEITGERIHSNIPAYYTLKEDDLERLGEKNLEKALIYYFPRIIFPWWDREINEDKDFTLYVNGEYKETDYLDKIDPFIVKLIKIWKCNYSNDDIWNNSKIYYTPIKLPCRKGNYVVLIITNDGEMMPAKETLKNK